jgi:hypothetical protein
MLNMLGVCLFEARKVLFMKSMSLLGSDQSGVASCAPAKKLVQLTIVFAMLIFGGAKARAAAPVFTLPSSITIGEDGSTNLPVGVTHRDHYGDFIKHQFDQQRPFIFQWRRHYPLAFAHPVAA